MQSRLTSQTPRSYRCKSHHSVAKVPAQQVSSPHARGSSFRYAISPYLPNVVPARAGIFLRVSASVSCSHSRPRTRGDLPSRRPVSAGENESSPHARGSSRCRLRADHAGDVVPARAGIFPGRGRHRRHRHGRPRTRGDLPPSRRRRSSARSSSPHARGSSQGSTSCPSSTPVVPARAGIFLPGSPAIGPTSRRPRTRGDLPLIVSSASSTSGSSPHARGSSRAGRVRVDRQAVVPARAGIFPRSPVAGWSSLRRPRTRGDLPGEDDQQLAARLSSPHARGSSPGRWPRGSPRGVVPARAGIFPSAGRSPTCPTCRPRTRGDLPANGVRRSRSMRSSPHARGSSRRPRARRGRRTVVPARAGIFRRRRPPRSRPLRRPRTRGDLPSCIRSIPRHGGSSPHARGSSLRDWRGGIDAFVVPARAGIFLGMSRASSASRRRPRTRGDLPGKRWSARDLLRSSLHARGSSHQGR